ncbi:MAG: hypothetical protein PHS37_00095 [Candidatus Omnitrophica bacterium]|nr:hypothetical protein [Candidatus Omnitrophota bacterium]
MVEENVNQDIACGIVLLLPTTMTERAIEANRVLSTQNANPLTLNATDRIPHITLGVGCLNMLDMPQIDGTLSHISKQFAAMHLATVPNTTPHAWFMIKKIKRLQFLHEAVMTGLLPYFSYNVTGDMIYRDQGEEIYDGTLEFIRTYPMASSFEDYAPHITVGSGDAVVPQETVEFTVTKVGLGRLGCHGTLRTIIRTYDLARGE